MMTSKKNYQSCIITNPNPQGTTWPMIALPQSCAMQNGDILITWKNSKSSSFLATITNTLTSAVIKYLEFNGHYVTRVQSQGQYSAKRGRWIKSKVKRGIGDIIACINGRLVMIEIKTGKDRQSEWQKTTEKEVKASGGEYWIVKEIGDLLKYYASLKKQMAEYEAPTYFID